MRFDSYYSKLNPEIKKYFNILSMTGIPKFLIPFIETKTMMRLKNVSYFCGMDYASKKIYDFKMYYSRLDHSIATALMVWNNTSDPKQTIIALFHDASTPAFSHVIDYMNGDYIKEESTELSLEEYLQEDIDLLHKLKVADISLEDLANFKNYSLIDCDRPKMCADRLDCTFMASYCWTKVVSMQEIEVLYHNTYVRTNEDGKEEFAFLGTQIADRILDLNDIVNHETHSDEDYLEMNLLAKLTKRLIDLEIIFYDDLYHLTDDDVMQIIRKSTVIDEQINIMYKTFISLVAANIKDKEPVKDKKIDPLLIKDFKTSRLSRI